MGKMAMEELKERVDIMCGRFTLYADSKKHRMPVLFDREQQFQAWLDHDNVPMLKDILTPYAGLLTVYPVSTAVNAAKHDCPQLIKKIGNK